MDEIVFLDQVGLSDKQRDIRRFISTDLGDGDKGVSSAECIQTVIPWCTTHNVVKMEDTPLCWLGGNVAGNICVISTGGPDHKWWKDETWTRRGENPDEG